MSSSNIQANALQAGGNKLPSSPGKWTQMSHDASAGAFAGFIARMITAPFDVIKIRQQLAKAGLSSKTTSLLKSFQGIVQEEGWLALWKGNLSATLLWVTYALIQFGLYGSAKTYIERLNEDETAKGKQSFSGWRRAFYMFVAGAGAGKYPHLHQDAF